MRFQDKVVVVTGGGSGIGRAISLRFASEGAKIAIADMNIAGARETEGMIRDAGGEALSFETNVTKSADTDELVSKVAEAWGHVDVLVNNAGIARDALVLRLKEEQWDAVLDTNLKGAFLCTKSVLKVMLRQKSGRIVNMASVMGLMGGAGQANYSAAKGGLIAMTKAVAREVASRGITCNAVAPGFIDTAMTRALPEEVREGYLRQIPMQHYGTPDDVAGVVAFLASDDAAYLTGHVIAVDGGLVM